MFVPSEFWSMSQARLSDGDNSTVDDEQAGSNCLPLSFVSRTPTRE